LVQKRKGEGGREKREVKKGDAVSKLNWKSGNFCGKGRRKKRRRSNERGKKEGEGGGGERDNGKTNVSAELLSKKKREERKKEKEREKRGGKRYEDGHGVALVGGHSATKGKKREKRMGEGERKEKEGRGIRCKADLRGSPRSLFYFRIPYRTIGKREQEKKRGKRRSQGGSIEAYGALKDRRLNTHLLIASTKR